MPEPQLMDEVPVDRVMQSALKEHHRRIKTFKGVPLKEFVRRARRQRAGE